MKEALDKVVVPKMINHKIGYEFKQTDNGIRIPIVTEILPKRQKFWKFWRKAKKRISRNLFRNGNKRPQKT